MSVIVTVLLFISLALAMYTYVSNGNRHLELKRDKERSKMVKRATVGRSGKIVLSGPCQAKSDRALTEP